MFGIAEKAKIISGLAKCAEDTRDSVSGLQKAMDIAIIRLDHLTKKVDAMDRELDMQIESLKKRVSNLEPDPAQKIHCPFCGSNNIGVHSPDINPACYYMMCENCEASGPAQSSEDTALRSWNVRVV